VIRPHATRDVPLAVRLALRAFPASFRTRYGDEMLRAFAAQHAQVRSVAGRHAAMVLVAATCRDLVASGMAERFHGLPAVAIELPDHPQETRMNTLLADVRFAWRALRRRPAFALVAIITLGVGIGASTAMFSIANGVVLRPLPYPESDRLVRVYDTQAEQNNMFGVSSPANFETWRRDVKSFSAMASYHNANMTYTGVEPALPLNATGVSYEWTSVLRVQPFLGRAFTKDDEVFGNHYNVILSYGLWQRQFGGASDIVGRPISIEGRSYNVVGVMPQGFAFPSPETDLWFPLAYNFDVATTRGVHFIVVIGRLVEGATLASASAEMSLVMDQLKAAFPEPLKGWGVRLASLHESIVGDVRQRVLIFLGAVGLLLLVACVNVANLSMAQAVGRFRELAVRAAMGAGRWRLTRQLAIEGLLLAIAAGVIGIALATLTTSTVLAVAPSSIPRLYDVSIDRSVLLFVSALCMITGVAIGMVPAVRAARRDVFDTLREGTRGGTGRAAHLMRSGFVVAQVSLAVVIAVGAGLLVKSFSRLTRVDSGVTSDGILVATLAVPQGRYREEAQRSQFILDYVDRLRALPGVTAAAATSQLPLEGYSIAFSFHRADREVPMSERPSGDFRVVSPGYFEAVGLKLSRGRTFDDRDRRGAPPVIVIDETLAKQQFGNEDPVGRFLKVDYDTGDDRPIEIIGVVADVKQRALNVATAPGYYFPLSQVTWSTQRVLIRTSLPPMSLADAMRKELAGMDALIPLRNIATLDDLTARSVGVPRFNMLLLGAFAALALILAASGIYSVMSYTVTERTREIGVRMALGARAMQVQAGVWRRALGLGVIGGVIGLGIAFAAAPQVATLLFEVDVHDPQAFILPPVLFLVVAWLGSYLPARRASRVDPVVALRAD